MIRLGYACVNLTLGRRTRSLRLATLRAQGLSSLQHLVDENMDLLAEILHWNRAHEIHFFRISSDLIPLGSHAEVDLTHLTFARAQEIAELAQGMRLSKVFPALSCAVPVIYSGHGEAAELLNANRCGLTTAPEDAPALARAVKALADNPSLRNQLGSNGRLLVEHDYSWTRPVLSPNFSSGVPNMSATLSQTLAMDVHSGATMKRLPLRRPPAPPTSVNGSG